MKVEICGIEFEDPCIFKEERFYELRVSIEAKFESTIIEFPCMPVVGMQISLYSFIDVYSFTNDETIIISNTPDPTISTIKICNGYIELWVDGD